MAVPGGWSRAAGGFLNSSPAGPRASQGGKQAEGAQPACHPMAPGPGQAEEGDRDGEGVRDRERQRDSQERWWARDKEMTERDAEMVSQRQRQGDRDNERLTEGMDKRDSVKM